MLSVQNDVCVLCTKQTQNFRMHRKFPQLLSLLRQPVSQRHAYIPSLIHNGVIRHAMQYSTTNEKLSSSPLSAAAAAAPPSQQQRQRQHGDKGKDSVFRNLLELFSDGPSLTTATAKEEEDGTTVKGEGHRSSDGKKENKWWGGVKFGVQMSPKEVHIPQGFDWLETPSTNTIFSDVDSSSSSSGIGGIGGIGMVTREMMVHMSELLDRVSVSEVFKQRCEVVQFQTIFNEFRQFIQSRNNFPELYDALLQFNTSIDELVICDFLLPYFTDFAQKRYPQGELHT